MKIALRFDIRVTNAKIQQPYSTELIDTATSNEWNGDEMKV